MGSVFRIQLVPSDDPDEFAHFVGQLHDDQVCVLRQTASPYSQCLIVRVIEGLVMVLLATSPLGSVVSASSRVHSMNW